MTHHTRATALRTYLDCPRKWHYVYGATGHKPPSTPAQIRGTAIHAELEASILGDSSGRSAVDPDHEDAVRVLEHLPAEGFSPLAQAGIAVLVRDVLPGHKVLAVEHAWGKRPEHPVPLGPGVHVSGTADLVLWQPDTRTLVIHDHKTVSDWKWAKTAEELRDDLQLNLYAWAVQQDPPCLLPPPARIVLQHLQLNKRTNTSRLTRVEVPPHHPEKTIQALLDLAPKLARDYSLPRSRVQPNRAACDKYGGCPHRASCQLTPHHNPTEDTMGFWDTIQKMKGAEPPTPTNDTPTPTEAPAPVTINPPDAQPDLQPVAPEDRTLESLGSITPKVQEALEKAGVFTAGGVANFDAIDGLESIPGVGAKRAEGIRAELEALGVVASTSTVPAHATMVQRPDGTIPTPTPEAPVNVAVVVKSTPSALESITTRPTSSPDTAPTTPTSVPALVVCIDCIPAKHPYAHTVTRPHARKEVIDAVKAIEAQHKVEHFTLAPYGKGQAELTAFAYACEWHGLVVINTAHPIDRACLPALLDKAALVIQG